jgi:putative ABC transport system ATP-binding protein
MDITMLITKALVAGYHTKPVAQLDDLALEKGQSALLLGASGAGKTTILLTLAGLLPRISGDVSIDGQDPAQGKMRDRDRFRGKNIGFMFQELNLVRGLSALENVLLAPFASNARQDQARAKSLLDAVGLGDQIGQSAATLSRGQAQRVALARALILSPKLLIVDEPTASLDDEATDIVGNLLVEAAQTNGAALLIATHDGRLKSRISQQVLVRAPS